MESILSSKLLTTRRGTIILGVGAAVLAAIALLVYLNQYRNSVDSGAQPVSVLVAKSLIQKGTPGNVVAHTALYQVASIPRNQVKSGALVDPSTLTGQVATVDIFPGQQLATSDFAVGTGNLLTESLARNQRAVNVSLDTTAVIGGALAAGDRVDVWVLLTAQGANGVSKPTAREVFQDMHVLAVSGGSVTFRATPRQAGELIYANSNAKIWLVLRPAVGSTNAKPPVITLNDLLGSSAQVGG